MEWKATKQNFARIIELERTPKGIKNKIALEPNHIALSLGPRPLVWTNQDLSLRKLKKDLGQTKIMIYDSKRHSSHIRQKHLINSAEEILSFEINFSFEITGDAGAIKLAESEIPADSGVVSTEILGNYLKRHCSGYWNSIFKGVTMDNRRDSEWRDRIAKRILDQFNIIGGRSGLVFSDCTITWRASQQERSDYNRAKAGRLLDELDSKYEIDGVQQLADNEKFSEEMRQTNAELAMDKLRSNVQNRRRDVQKDNEIEAIKRENEIKKAHFEGRSELRNLAKEERMKSAKRMEASELKKTKIMIDDVFAKVADLEDKIKFNLDPEKEHRIITSKSLLIDLKGVKVDLTQFVSNLRTRVKSGAHNATEIDTYISGLVKIIEDNPAIHQRALSDIYACIAEFHRHRGNKSGEMEMYLSRSLSLNEYNMTALRTKIDYLWDRSPQQFIPRKSHLFEGQLNEIKHLINKIQEKDPYFEDAENFDLMERAGIVSEALLNCR